MNIKNALMGVMGAGLVAGSFSLSADVTVEVDGRSFLVPTNIEYRPLDRIVVHSRYGWVDFDANSPCVADLSKGDLELRVLGPNGQAVQFLVDSVAYHPGSKTFQVTTTSGGAANCVTELLYWSRFQSTDPGPTPGS